MTKYFFIIFYMLQVSCTHNVPSNIIDKFETNKISVNSDLEAKKIMLNRIKYLQILFEQSTDPYYGTPKWSEECLRSNQIGKLIENKKHALLISTLFLDHKGAPGHCKGARYKSILTHCLGGRFIFEYNVPLEIVLPSTGFIKCSE